LYWEDFGSLMAKVRASTASTAYQSSIMFDAAVGFPPLLDAAEHVLGLNNPLKAASKTEAHHHLGYEYPSSHVNVPSPIFVEVDEAACRMPFPCLTVSCRNIESKGIVKRPVSQVALVIVATSSFRL
jgi:hypothetical protein